VTEQTMNRCGVAVWCGAKQAQQNFAPNINQSVNQSINQSISL